MTPDELNDRLDALALEAAENADLMPGLVTVQADHWINVLGVVGAKAATLADGLRYRNIKMEIALANTPAVLTRTDAGERGEPYRDLTARP